MSNSWVSLKPLKRAPEFFQRLMGTRIRPVRENENGKFACTGIELERSGALDRRICVQVLDKNGCGLNNVLVGFSYSSLEADKRLILGPAWEWEPTQDKYFTTITRGGWAEMILGAEAIVNPGSIGGVTVEILQPDVPSDAVSGLGMLKNHNSPLLTFVYLD